MLPGITGAHGCHPVEMGRSHLVRVRVWKSSNYVQPHLVHRGPLFPFVWLVGIGGRVEMLIWPRDLDGHCVMKHHETIWIWGIDTPRSYFNRFHVLVETWCLFVWNRVLLFASTLYPHDIQNISLLYHPFVTHFQTNFRTQPDIIDSHWQIILPYPHFISMISPLFHGDLW